MVKARTHKINKTRLNCHAKNSIAIKYIKQNLPGRQQKLKKKKKNPGSLMGVQAGGGHTKKNLYKIFE